MLRLIDPEETAPTTAYRVPWRVEMASESFFTLVNESPDRLTCVSTQFFEHGRSRPAVPRANIDQGETLQIDLDGSRVEATQITIHWRAPDGVEYAWTVVL